MDVSSVREDWLPVGTPPSGSPPLGASGTTNEPAWDKNSRMPTPPEVVSPTPPGAPLTPGAILTPRTEVILFKEGLSEYIPVLGSAGMKSIGDLARSGVRASDLQIFGITNTKHQERLMLLSRRRIQQEEAANGSSASGKASEQSAAHHQAPLSLSSVVPTAASHMPSRPTLLNPHDLPPSPQSIRDSKRLKEKSDLGRPVDGGPCDRVCINVISARSAPAPGGMHGSPPQGVVPKPPRLRADCEYSVRVGLCDFVSGTVKKQKDSSASTMSVLGPIPVFVQGSASNHKPNFMSATASISRRQEESSAVQRAGSHRSRTNTRGPTTTNEAALSVRTRLGRAASQPPATAKRSKHSSSAGTTLSESEEWKMCVEHDDPSNDLSRLVCHTNFQSSCIIVELVEHAHGSFGKERETVVGVSVFPMSFYHRFDAQTVVDSWFPIRELKPGDGCVLETSVIYDSMMHPLRTPVHMGVGPQKSSRASATRASAAVSPLGHVGNLSSSSMLDASTPSSFAADSPFNQQPQQQGGNKGPSPAAGSMRKSPPVVAMIRLAFQVPGGCPKQLSPAFHISSINMNSRHLYFTVFDMCVFKTTGEAQTFRDDWQRVLSGNEAVAFSSLQLSEWHRQATATGSSNNDSEHKRLSLKRPAAADSILLLNKPLERQYCSIRMDGFPRGTARRSKVVEEATYRPQFNEQFGWGSEITECKCISLRLKQRRGGFRKPEIIGAAHVPIQYFLSKPSDHADKVVLLMDVHNPYIIRAACFVRLQVIAAKDAPQVEVAEGPVAVPSRIEQIAAHQEYLRTHPPKDFSFCSEATAVRSEGEVVDLRLSDVDDAWSRGGDGSSQEESPPSPIVWNSPYSDATQSQSPNFQRGSLLLSPFDRVLSGDSMSGMLRRVESEYTDADLHSPHLASLLAPTATRHEDPASPVAHPQAQNTRLRTYDDLLSPLDVHLGELDPIPEDHYFTSSPSPQPVAHSLRVKSPSREYPDEDGSTSPHDRRSPTLPLLQYVAESLSSSGRTLSLVSSSPTLSLSSTANVDSFALASVPPRPPSLSLSSSLSLPADDSTTTASSSETQSSSSSSSDSSSSPDRSSLSSSSNSSRATSITNAASPSEPPSPSSKLDSSTDRGSSATASPDNRSSSPSPSKLNFGSVNRDEESDEDTDATSPLRLRRDTAPSMDSDDPTSHQPPALPFKESLSAEPHSREVSLPARHPNSGFPNHLLPDNPPVEGTQRFESSVNSILLTPTVNSSLGTTTGGSKPITPRKRSVQFVAGDDDI